MCTYQNSSVCMLKTCIWLDKLEINKEPLAFFKGQIRFSHQRKLQQHRKSKGKSKAERTMACVWRGKGDLYAMLGSSDIPIGAVEPSGGLEESHE